jgi:hypothetical protein
MSDLATAANTAKLVSERIAQASKLAQPGTFAHGQMMSAALMMEWPRIQFCLEVLERQKTA